MSVWPACRPDPGLGAAEGELVSVRVSVEPRWLEELLEILARLDFPINPQIYHNAAAVYVYPDGRNLVHRTTLVEFPAYEGRISAVRSALEGAGFPSAAIRVKRMLDDFHSDFDVDPAPPGSTYSRVITYKHQVPSRV